MPRIWNMSGKISGINLGFGQFRFDFLDERDIDIVLSLGQRGLMAGWWRWLGGSQRLRLISPHPFSFGRFRNLPDGLKDEEILRLIGPSFGEMVDVGVIKGIIKVELQCSQPLMFETIKIKERRLRSRWTTKHEHAFAPSYHRMTHDKEISKHVIYIDREMAKARRDASKHVNHVKCYKGALQTIVEGTSRRRYPDGNEANLEIPKATNFRSQGQRSNKQCPPNDVVGDDLPQVPYEPTLLVSGIKKSKLAMIPTQSEASASNFRIS